MSEIWEVAECKGVQEVLGVLNGRITHGVPVADAKIGLGATSSLRNRQKFYVFFLPQRQPREVTSWHCHETNAPDKVTAFLNDLGKADDLLNLSVAGLRSKSYHFFLFYQRGPGHSLDLAGPWQWQTTDNRDFARGLLNGYGRLAMPMQHPRVAVMSHGSNVEFHLFYRHGDAGQIRDNWITRDFSNTTDLLARLNRGTELTSPASDQRLFTTTQIGDHFLGYLFHPKGLLVITRPLFIPALKAYIRWKEARGFEVFPVLGEWIDQTYSGINVRFKIQACIREYSSLRWVAYALLIGDSDDNQPALGNLTTPWNLPAGMYSYDNMPLYTTLFYGDFTNKTNYSGSEPYAGQYNVPVGVIPAREISEVDNVLKKTMKATPADDLTMIYSHDIYNDNAKKVMKHIYQLAPDQINFQSYVFSSEIDTTGKINIYDALFQRKGVIIENGHGNVGHFCIGSTTITNQDATRFRYKNPLFITLSCLVQSYHLGDCLAEAFLRFPRGPAVILAPRFPEGGPPDSAERPLGATAKKAWMDIFQGKSIGKAVCDNAPGATTDSIHIFGDPSLVVFPGETPYPLKS